jgi:tetratricopeptide (TPR) repeat protein
MQTRIVYSIAIGLLVLFAIIIVIKLLFIPPCIPTGLKNPTCTYIVDSWSLAGLAATVMGVAATVLALLGAVAVAAWWSDLEKRVDAKVNDLFNEQLKLINDQLEKKQQEVVDLQEKLVEDSENTSKAIANLILGNQLWEHMKKEQAITLYMKARALRPQDPQINYVLGRAFKEVGLYGEAIDCLKVAIQKDPEFGQAYMQYGLAIRFQVDEAFKSSKDEDARDDTYQQVISHLKRAIKLLPNDEEPLATLGGTYRRLNKYQRSLEYYKKALVVNPESSYSRGNVGLLSLHEGDIDLAHETFKQVEAVATEHIDSHSSDELYWDYYDRGMARLALNQKESALKDYRVAILQTPAPGVFWSVKDGLNFLKGSKVKQSIDGLDDALKMVEDALSK